MSVGQLKGNRKSENGSVVYHSLNVNVPKHWIVVPLEKVLDNIIGGGTPSKTNPEYWAGSIPWLSVKDMRTRRPADAIDHISKDAVRDSATNIIPAGTVIIATRIGLGKVVRVPYDAAINQDLKALVPKPELEKGYLEYWILSIAEYLESIGSGTTVKGIRLEQLRSLPFPLAPLDEQKLIVAEIEQFSRLDEAVANLKRIKANLKRYKAAVLKAAVEGKLTEAWRKTHPDVEPASKLLARILTERRAKWKGKYKEPAAPDTNNLPLLPDGWTWSVTDQLGLVQLGRQRSPKNRSKDHPVKYLRAANITEAGLDLSDLLDMEFSPAEQERYRLKSGDLLLSEASGSLNQVGKPAVWQEQIPLCCFQNTVIRLRPSINMWPYILMCFKSYYVNGIFAKVAGGVGINHLSADKFSKVTVPLPPVVEQDQIVAEVERRLSVIEELESTVKANLIRANCLRQSILRRAFSGQLSFGLEPKTSNCDLPLASEPFSHHGELV